MSPLFFLLLTALTIALQFLVDPETDNVNVQWINPDGCKYPLYRTSPLTCKPITCSAIAPAYVVEYTNLQWSYGIFITGDLSTLATAMGTTISNLNQIVSSYAKL